MPFLEFIRGCEKSFFFLFLNQTRSGRAMNILLIFPGELVTEENRYCVGETKLDNLNTSQLNLMDFKIY